jgi:hypothetical protein
MSSYFVAIPAVMLIGSLVAAAEVDTSKRLDPYTYCERREDVTVVLSSRLAFTADDEAHLPIQIAVGVSGYDTKLTVSRASFVLIDSSGGVHPMAPFKEVDQGLILGVRKVEERAPLGAGNAFLDLAEVHSNFYPVGAASGSGRVELRRRNHFKDILYFPRPETGTDGVLTMQFVAKGLAEPIQVRFRLSPEHGKEKPKGKEPKRSEPPSGDGEDDRLR